MSLRRRYAEDNSVSDWLASGDPNPSEVELPAADEVETPAVDAEQLSLVELDETPSVDEAPADEAELPASWSSEVDAPVVDEAPADEDELPASWSSEVETPAVDEAPADDDELSASWSSEVETPAVAGAPADEAPVDEAELPASWSSEVETPAVEAEAPADDALVDEDGLPASWSSEVETPAADDASQVDAPDDSTLDDSSTVEATPVVAAARTRWQRTRRPLLVVAAAAAVLLTAGAGTWVAMSKTVTITVDGQEQQITTLAGSVDGALEAAGLSVAEHDSLAPAAGESISDGSAIAINRGRQITMTIDGKEVTVWTTAKTVEEAFAEVGRNPGDYELSADRSRAIPLEGLAVTGESLHTVKTVDGTGKAVSTTTTAKTVADLLAENKIVLGDKDTVEPATGTALTDGLTVTVTRVTTSQVVVQEVLPQLPDGTVDGPDLAVGSTEVVSTGAAGSADVTFEVTSVNGVESSRTEVARVVTLEPTATVTKIGSKPSYEQIGNRVFFHDTEFGVNWDGLAECESTNNPKAVDPTGSWYGMFQFDFSTWESVGGSGNPADASPEEQLMRAKLLYQSRGLQPWLCAHAA